MGRLPHHPRRQHQRLHHLDSGSLADQQNMVPPQRNLGPMRKGHICTGRWFLERLLHLPRPLTPHWQRPDQVLSLILHQLGAHLCIPVPGCKFTGHLMISFFPSDTLR